MPEKRQRTPTNSPPTAKVVGDSNSVSTIQDAQPDQLLPLRGIDSFLVQLDEKLALFDLPAVEKSIRRVERMLAKLADTKHVIERKQSLQLRQQMFRAHSSLQRLVCDDNPDRGKLYFKLLHPSDQQAGNTRREEFIELVKLIVATCSTNQSEVAGVASEIWLNTLSELRTSHFVSFVGHAPLGYMQVNCKEDLSEAQIVYGCVLPRHRGNRLFSVMLKNLKTMLPDSSLITLRVPAGLVDTLTSSELSAMMRFIREVTCDQQVLTDATVFVLKP